MQITNKTTVLTIFFDGNCPLCSLEMDKLKQHNRNDAIKFVNLHQPDFQSHYPNIDVKKAMRILHGYYHGKILLGLDVTHRAWTLVGKGVFVAPLAFPVFKQIAHICYLLVAKFRQPISHFLYRHLDLGKNVCNKGACYEKTNKPNNRR
jgi:predicted DCC family thiol-disulfide oxidoreductase YuxK